MDLNNAVVVITGASSGIGAATARAASAAGARVALLARRADRLHQLAAELGEAIAVPCDVTHSDQVIAAVRTVLDTYGRIDVLVNNAGQGLQAAVDEIRIDDYRELLDLNLVAPLVAMQAVIPAMRKQGSGSIVNVSSGIALSVIPATGAYASSKAALSHLSFVARKDLADAGIAVSTLYPFITATDFVASLKAGREAGRELERDHGPQPDSPERVAATILDLIRTGAEKADLVSQRLGGSVEN